jgi:Cu-processing system permease protein
VSGLPVPRALRPTLTVARKEFMDNVRGWWVIILTALFAVLTLVWSVVVALQEGRGVTLSSFEGTVLGMISITAILVPILCLMLSYATIGGERENGSLQLMLTMPVTRFEVLSGKVLGIASVVSFSLFAGLGSAGVAIAAVAGPEGSDAFVVFLLGGVLTAFSFVSLGTFFSALTERRSRALGLAVLVWVLLVLLYPSVLFGVYLGTGGSVEQVMQTLSLPDWYYAVDLFSPSEAFQFFGTVAFGLTEFNGIDVSAPAFVTLELIALDLLAWALVPFFLAAVRFERLDL